MALGLTFKKQKFQGHWKYWSFDHLEWTLISIVLKPNVNSHTWKDQQQPTNKLLFVCQVASAKTQRRVMLPSGTTNLTTQR